MDEIRHGAALFLSFGGFEFDQDGAAGDKLDAYVQWVQDVLARRSGYLIQLSTGDKGNYLYAAFGAPVAHEDYIHHAVAAALELRSPPPELNFVSNIRIGLSSGWMHSGPYGSTMRRTYGVLGPETNMAAGLMEQAEIDQILATGRIAEAVNQIYRIEKLAPIKLKGKPEPSSVYAVLGRRWAPTKKLRRDRQSSLIGRTAERTILAQQAQGAH